MLPTSTIRGFFEILMPGVFLVLNVALTVFLLITILIPAPVPGSWLSDLAGNQVLVAMLVFVFGYPAGMALRLLKNGRFDRDSARYNRLWRWLLRKDAAPLFRKNHKRTAEEEALRRNEMLFLSDHFFYGNWMKEKLNTRMPAEMVRFYNDFWADKYGPDGNQNTSFFNFCKTVVAKVNPHLGSEVYAAEAGSRFLAGMYYALQIAVLLLLASLGVVLYSLLKPGSDPATHPLCWEWITIIGGMMVSYLFLLHIMLMEFRGLRAKEVDTVFNAVFALRKEFEKLFLSTSSRRRVSELEMSHPRFAQYRDLLLDAYEETWDDAKGRLVQGINLDRLVDSMRKQRGGAGALTSLYFAGAENDHPFFLNNRDVAAGLSVLPEDAVKSGRRKRHPCQTEFFIVLRGAICVHTEVDDQETERVLQAHEYAVIPPGTCHWITAIEGEPAVYLFVKTNPSEQPREQPCGPHGL